MSKVPHPSPPHSTARGIFIGLLSAFFFALMALFVRLCKSDANAYQLLFLRAISSIAILGIICRKDLLKLVKPGARFIWLRSLFGGISVLCLFWNLQNAPTAVSVVLSDMSPIFIVIIGYFFLGTRVTLIAFSGIILSIFGVCLLSLPKSSDLSLSVATIGGIGALSAACAYLSLKKVASKYSPFLIVFTFSLVMLLFSLKEIATIPELLTRINLVYALGMALSSLLAQLLMTKSYIVLTAHAASSLTLTSCLWALAFDVLILNTNLTLEMGIAFFIIITGVRLAQHRH